MTEVSRRLAGLIVNHEHWPQAVAQLQFYHHDHPQLAAAVDWRIIHNGGALDSDLLPDDVPVSSQVRCIENRGYGAAINLGAQDAAADWLLVLNADLEPMPGFLPTIDQLLDDVPADVGVIGPQLLNADRSPQGSIGRLPTLTTLLTGLRLPRERRKYLTLHVDRPRPAPWLSGACLLIRRQCFVDLAGFDAGFFMYYEDVDFCHRAQQAGWRILCEPRLQIIHMFPFQTRRLSYRMALVARHGLLRYFWKHRPGWEQAVLRRLVWLDAWRRRRQPGWDAVRNMIEAFARDPEGTRIEASQLA